MGPAMRARGFGGGGTQGAGPALGEDAAAFIPPHQFSQRDDFTMGSFVPGETPGVLQEVGVLHVRNSSQSGQGCLPGQTQLSHGNA